jgi:aryl-alcohol dehydrogenase-like predicted oxidoreductase
MEERSFGRHALKSSALGFGTWPIGGSVKPGDYGRIDENDAIQAIRHALGLGITLFDTAPAYGFGRAEEILAEALGSDRKDVSVVTKCGVQWDDTNKTWLRISTYGEIVMSAESSLRRLKTDYLDLLLIHLPDS